MANATFRLNFSHLTQLIGEDSEFIIEVLEIIESETPDTLEEMKLHLQKKNYSRLSGTAHKYKSSINVLGSQELIALVKNIELKAKNHPEHKELENLMQDFEFACKSLMDQITRQLAFLRSQV